MTNRIKLLLRGRPLPLLIAFLLTLSVTSTAGAQACPEQPDAFDYSCYLSDFMLDQVASPTNITGDDQVGGPFAIPFSFEYYGQSYTSVYVSSNGFLTFLPNQGTGCCSGQAFPSGGTPNSTVAGVWSDLHPRGGNITYGTVGEAPNRRFVVSWNNIVYLGSNANLSFQIALHEGANDVEIRHGAIGAPGRSTVSSGMENQNGTIGIQIGQGNITFPSERSYRMTRRTFRADAGGTYNITEGTPSIEVSGENSRGEIVEYAWDLDMDGEYDDFIGPVANVDTSGLDGPGEQMVGLRVTNTDQETDETTALIQATNVPPEISSTPGEVANIGSVYSYAVTVSDPGILHDPPIYTFLEGPGTAAVSQEGLVTWSPGISDFETTVQFILQVDDGDEGIATQEWSVTVFAPDEDGDGVEDSLDNCPVIANEEQLDNDDDGDGDVCDDDDDNDGHLDLDDNCRFVANPDQENNDVDTEGDACDEDDDNDQIPDEVDNCVFVANPSQIDSDDDGEGDACEGDVDQDFITDERDNCVDVPNTDQLDTDRDGEGDACDEDDDNDGLDDETEAELGTDPTRADSDNDGLTDQEETTGGTDPTLADSDADGIDDGEEARIGTDPLDEDSDDDGLTDGEEIEQGTNPGNADTDSDGLSDGEEVELGTDPNLFDSDNGGVNDGAEVERGTNPRDPTDDVQLTPGNNNGPANNGTNNSANNGGLDNNGQSPDPPAGGTAEEDGCSVAREGAGTPWWQMLLRR